MSSLIFIDANVPVYATGRPHALKDPCQQVLALVAARPEAFFTDAEVLQELLHRYSALHIWPQGKPVFYGFATLMRDRVEPIHAVDVEEAAALVDRQPGLSARDLLHFAVMRRLGANQIISADRDFERVSELQRLDPGNLVAWRGQIAD